MLEKEERDKLFVLRIISAGISTIGISVIFVTYLFACIKQKVDQSKSHLSSDSTIDNTNKVKFSHNLIFLISLSDLIFCIAAFIDTRVDLRKDSKIISTPCIVQGFLYNFSEISTICFTTGLSIFIYCGTVLKLHFNTINKYFKWLVFYGVIPALTLSIIPLPFYTDHLNSYGPTDQWCWIQVTNNNYCLPICFFCFNWLNMLFNIYVIFKTVLFFRYSAKIHSEDETNVKNLQQFCLFLIAFPSILVLCWFFPTLNRLYGIITGDENYVYSIGTAIAMSSMGFLNSIVYFIVYFKNYYTCCNKKQSMEFLIQASKIDKQLHADVERNEFNIQ